MTEVIMREALVAASRELVTRGLNGGTTGNLSIRHGERMLITPTGILPDAMRPEQIVDVGLDGAFEGAWRPSSEWEIHARLYGTTTTAAVVHAHPDHCVALSCLHRPIPAFHYMVAGFGGDEIPCARYASFGSPALAETVIEAMGTRYAACLLASHGMVAVGSSLDAALARAQKLETLARQYLLALSVGEPVLLTADQLAEVRARYGTYGVQPAKNDARV